MSDIKSLNVNNREPLQTGTPLRPMVTPNRVPADADSGSTLPPQAKSSPVAEQPGPASVSRPVREASTSEAANQAEREAEPSEESLSNAITQMNEFIQSTQRDLRFNIDRETGETVVKVIDRQTEEVIRQIPDELFLKLARHLNEDEPVHLFNEQA